MTAIRSDDLAALPAERLINGIDVVARSAAREIALRVLGAGIHELMAIRFYSERLIAHVTECEGSVTPPHAALAAMKPNPCLSVLSSKAVTIEGDMTRGYAHWAARRASVVCEAFLECVMFVLRWTARDRFNAAKTGACIRSFAGTLPINRAARSELCKHDWILP